MRRVRLWLWTVTYRLRSLPIEGADVVGGLCALMVFEGVRGLLGVHSALLVLGGPLWAAYLWRELRPATPRRRP